MSTGMKKFTKGCLLTALVIFILGGMICLVGGLLGGFRQLAGLNIRGITGIPFRYAHNGSDFQYGFGWDDDDWEDGWKQYENWTPVDDTGGGTQLELTADTLRYLDIGVGDCELFIKESQNDHVWISASGDMKYLRYHVEDGDTLRLVRKSDWVFWNWTDGSMKPTTQVYLYLPKNAHLDCVDIEFGAGNLESINLQAREINVEVGAGACMFDGLTASGYVDMTVGAGQIQVKSMEANGAELEIGVGKIDVDNARIMDSADILVGLGEITLSGQIQSDMDLECDMGNVILILEGRAEDYNYEIDCDMGSVSIGGTTYRSLGDEKEIYNGSSSTFGIDCDLGNVSIGFMN